MNKVAPSWRLVGPLTFFNGQETPKKTTQTEQVITKIGRGEILTTGTGQHPKRSRKIRKP
ncbi:Hypothetical protein BFG00_0415 [Corynebacterium pseudotuberculosis]|nr:Hypothetical protein CpE19_0395 [Corynebacterium pseudotuberculosis]ATB61314.1 Hypothetical protein BFF96_0419 [Corynebacterium pseudotuberculosis]ATD14513.1 hypothetical protein ATN04_10770 [Corynebacterium pseudotuberculosis]AUY59803.1 Hypothetical protein BFG00_0415 [Corynebacterium pseudotuberculosis]